MMLFDNIQSENNMIMVLKSSATTESFIMKEENLCLFCKKSIQFILTVSAARTQTCTLAALRFPFYAFSAHVWQRQANQSAGCRHECCSHPCPALLRPHRPKAL